VRFDHVASFYQRHDRENLPFSIHLDVALIGHPWGLLLISLPFEKFQRPSPMFHKEFREFLVGRSPRYFAETRIRVEQFHSFRPPLRLWRIAFVNVE
jgi:hypothetical protein